MDWLLFGDVDGDKNERHIKQEYLGRAYGKAVISANNENNLSGWEAVWAEQDSENFEFPDVYFVPLFDVQVSAGAGIEVYGEHVIQMVPFSRKWLAGEGLFLRNLACLPVEGDSMFPSLMSTDIVLVNHAKTSGDGIFVLRMGNMLRIKRLQWLYDGKLRISSDNPVYQPETINPAELGDEFAVIAACHTRISRVL